MQNSFILLNMHHFVDCTVIIQKKKLMQNYMNKLLSYYQNQKSMHFHQLCIIIRIKLISRSQFFIAKYV